MADLVSGAHGEGAHVGHFTFTNRLMFNRVVSTPDIFVDLVEVVTGIRFELAGDPQAERTFEPTLSSKGVRMDVVAVGDDRVVDIEMQTQFEPYLGKRLRYYQAALDVSHLDKGSDYGVLPESFIIFLCTHDPFGRGLPVYTLGRCCVEDSSVDVGDESHWIVLNATAYAAANDGQLADVLEYAATGEVRHRGGLVGRIDEAVRDANNDSGWVRNVESVMSLEDGLRMRYQILMRDEVAAARKAAAEEGRAEGMARGIAEGIAEGRAEGIAEERARTAMLAKRLEKEGRIDELAGALADSKRFDALLVEFGL